MENKKDSNIFRKTTKLVLVVYFPLISLFLVICLLLSGLLHNWSYVYGFLVCLLPSLFFILISAFIPIERVFTYGKKQIIFGWCVLYVIKYIVIFLVPILCVIYGSNIFDKWVMLTMTLLAPIIVFIIKLITTYSSKNKQKDTKTPINSIKF